MQASSTLTSCDPELSLLPLGYNFPSEDPPGTLRPVQLEWTLFLGKTPRKQQVTCNDFSPCVSGVPVAPPSPILGYLALAPPRIERFAESSCSRRPGWLWG